MHGGQALQSAAEAGLEAAILWLLENGADVNAQGGVYANALQAASYSGNENVVHILLEKGADVNAQGGEYCNTLQAASYRGLENVVRILLEKGTDVNAQGGRYGNALHWVAREVLFYQYGQSSTPTGMFTDVTPHRLVEIKFPMCPQISLILHTFSPA